LAELEKLVNFICKISDFKPRYNIAPRSNVPVLVCENNQTVLKEMRWSLIPSWSKDEKIGNKLTNARAETLTEKPSFKKPFLTQRCLIPADGYYEWQRSGTSKIPFQFTLLDDRFFAWLVSGNAGFDLIKKASWIWMTPALQSIKSSKHSPSSRPNRI
jgi:putative SOS response-associated peptidase YedK